jgi:hypothetical protein
MRNHDGLTTYQTKIQFTDISSASFQNLTLIQKHPKDSVSPAPYHSSLLTHNWCVQTTKLTSVTLQPCPVVCCSFCWEMSLVFLTYQTPTHSISQPKIHPTPWLCESTQPTSIKKVAFSDSSHRSLYVWTHVLMRLAYVLVLFKTTFNWF